MGRNRGNGGMQLSRLGSFYSSTQFAMKKKGCMMTTLSVTTLVYESQLLTRLYFRHVWHHSCCTGYQDFGNSKIGINTCILCN